MKKIIALSLCLVSTVAILCSCRPKQILNSSSAAAGIESSVAGFEDLKSEINSNKTSSKNEASDKSSSKKENNSSEDKSSSNKSSSNKNEDSSKTPSKKNETTSVSTSSSVKVPVNSNTVEIGCFQFSPYYCINYADEYTEINDGNMDIPIEKKLEEFEDVLAEGYFNSVFLNYNDVKNEKLWQILEKYDVKVWIALSSYYKESRGQTIEEFMTPYLAPFDFIKDNPKRWAMFNGILYDEVIHRGCTIEDFNIMSEYLYKKVGKRCFQVMAPQECTKLWWGGEQQQTIEGTKYVTDIAFDMYAGDVRDNGINHVAEYASSVYPEYEIYDDADVYRTMTSEMLKLVDHPVNVWFFPTSHKFTANHTESFCLDQLQFFEELLEEQERLGGLVLYTYAQAAKGLYGLASFLDLGENANKTIRKQEGQVWYYYSKYLKDLTMKYRNTPNNPTIDLGA